MLAKIVKIWGLFLGLIVRQGKKGIGANNVARPGDQAMANLDDKFDASNADDKFDASQNQIAAQAGKPFRTFLLFILGLALIWELVARPLLLHFMPNLELPPSFLADILNLLTMLGI